MSEKISLDSSDMIMKNTILKRITVIALLASTIIFSGQAENKESQLAPFYSNCTGIKCLNPEQIICKPDESGKYLKAHRKYKFTYDSENRVIEKAAYKWNEHKQKWTPDYLQTFKYSENQIETEYSAWNKRSKSYTSAKEKAIYKTCDLGVIAYTSYKSNSSDNEWKLITNLPEISPNKLIVEK